MSKQDGRDCPKSLTEYRPVTEGEKALTIVYRKDLFNMKPI